LVAVRADRRILETELLVTQFQRGERRAFEQIVRLWETPLFYYLRRLAASEEDAWDLLQETWLKAFRSLGKLREPRTLPAFLYRVARNAAISRLRSDQVRQDAADAQDVNGAFAADDIAVFDNAEQIHHALDQLPLLQREALTLFFLHDLSLQEMSELLEVSVGTVKSRVHYAKSTMRKILSESGVKHVQ
jgi:RNA polymerase sigma-70 factor (ECF subfamily)